MALEPLTLAQAEIVSYYKHKTVLVTGAGGSIGSAICKRLIEEGVKELRMVSVTENALYQLMKSLHGPAARGTDAKLVGILGSVNNYELMTHWMRGVDVVIHAAAHKHVLICEENVCEAVHNNVFGTERVAIIAGKSGVKDFVFISTDKAVKPASVMGATKRLAELAVHGTAKNFKDTRYRVVRFGNVYGSAGSVIPLWLEQIKAGGPVTITDPDATRYFMEVNDAVALVLTVPQLDNTAVGPYVLDMGKPRRMGDVLENLIGEHAPVESWESLGERIQTIGLRPGEKLHEELYYDGDRVHTACKDINLIRERAARLTWLDFEALLHLVKLQRNEDAREHLFRLVQEPLK